MVRSLAWGDTRPLGEVIAENHRKLCEPEACDAIALKNVRAALISLANTRALYTKMDRGKTLRSGELRQLHRIIVELDQGLIGPDTFDLIRSAYCELHEEPELAETPDGLHLQAKAIVKRLEGVVQFKFARRWLPFIYGAAIPEIGWSDAKITPAGHSKTLDKADGLSIEFVRVCLEELGEKDVSPETIAGRMKLLSRPRERTYWEEHPFEFQHPWIRHLGEARQAP